MLLLNNADVKQQLLAGSSDEEDSDDSSAASEISDFGLSSDEEVEEKKTDEKAMAKPEKKLSENEGKDFDEDENSVSELVPLTQLKPLDFSNKADISLDDESDYDELQPKKKRIKRDSTEREIFSKKLLENDDKGASKKPFVGIAVKPEQKSRVDGGSKSKDNEELPPNPKGTIDVSMFESKKEMKESDLNKIFEKRANTSTTVAGPSTAVVPLKPAPVVNEDEWISLSSDSDSELSAHPSGNGRHIPKRKKMLTEEELQEETKRAQKEETQRVERLKKKTEALTQMLSQRFSQEPDSQEDVVLDYNPKTDVTIKVHRKLVKYLKEHQKEGIKFMYDTCYGSIADDVATESGCILAHW